MKARKVVLYKVTDSISIHLLIMVKLHKHPDLIKKIQNKLSEEEKYELKYFRPHYLDAEAWDEKNIEISSRDVDVDVSASQKIYDEMV